MSEEMKQLLTRIHQELKGDLAVVPENGAKLREYVGNQPHTVENFFQAVKAHAFDGTLVWNVPPPPPNLVADALALFNKALLPAKIKQTNRIGYLLVSWATDDNDGKTPRTPQALADAFLAAIKSRLNSPEIPWDSLDGRVLKPKKLLAQEALDAENKKPMSLLDGQKNAIKEEESWSEKVRAGEAKDALDKKRADGIRRCKELINGYLPMNHRRGSIDYDEQAKTQATLRKYFEEQQAKPNVDMNDVAAKIHAYIQERYAAQQREAERV